MMIMPTPSAELYQAMASASAKAVTTEGKFLETIQQGFISCVKNISNSLVAMKDAVVEGYHRLTTRMKPSAAKAPESTLNVTSLNPISGADTRKFCQEVKQKMTDNPNSINGMFRESPTIAYDKFNQQLKNHNDFLAAIKNDEIDNIAAGFFIKKWMGQIFEEKKFSLEERNLLVANKDNSIEVNKIFESKFDSPEADNVENRDKFVSLLSVMRAYKELSASNGNMELRQHDQRVVGLIAIPLTFDVDEKKFIASKSIREREINETLTAFTALLEHCSQAVPLMQDMPHSH